MEHGHLRSVEGWRHTSKEDLRQENLRAELSRCLHTPLYLPTQTSTPHPLPHPHPQLRRLFSTQAPRHHHGGTGATTLCSPSKSLPSLYPLPHSTRSLPSVFQVSATVMSTSGQRERFTPLSHQCLCSDGNEELTCQSVFGGKRDITNPSSSEKGTFVSGLPCSHRFVCPSLENIPGYSRSILESRRNTVPCLMTEEQGVKVDETVFCRHPFEREWSLPSDLPCQVQEERSNTVPDLTPTLENGHKGRVGRLASEENSTDKEEPPSFSQSLTSISTRTEEGQTRNQDHTSRASDADSQTTDTEDSEFQFVYADIDDKYMSDSDVRRASEGDLRSPRGGFNRNELAWRRRSEGSNSRKDAKCTVIRTGSEAPANTSVNNHTADPVFHDENKNPLTSCSNTSQIHKSESSHTTARWVAEARPPTPTSTPLCFPAVFGDYWPDKFNILNLPYGATFPPAYPTIPYSSGQFVSPSNLWGSADNVLDASELKALGAALDRAGPQGDQLGPTLSRDVVPAWDISSISSSSSSPSSSQQSSFEDVRAYMQACDNGLALQNPLSSDHPSRSSSENAQASAKASTNIQVPRHGYNTRSSKQWSDETDAPKQPLDGSDVYSSQNSSSISQSSPWEVVGDSESCYESVDSYVSSCTSFDHPHRKSSLKGDETRNKRERRKKKRVTFAANEVQNMMVVDTGVSVTSGGESSSKDSKMTPTTGTDSATSADQTSAQLSSLSLSSSSSSTASQNACAPSEAQKIQESAPVRKVSVSSVHDAATIPATGSQGSQDKPDVGHSASSYMDVTSQSRARFSQGSNSSSTVTVRSAESGAYRKDAGAYASGNHPTQRAQTMAPSSFSNNPSRCSGPPSLTSSTESLSDFSDGSSGHQRPHLFRSSSDTAASSRVYSVFTNTFSSFCTPLPLNPWCTDPFCMQCFSSVTSSPVYYVPLGKSLFDLLMGKSGSNPEEQTRCQVCENFSRQNRETAISGAYDRIVCAHMPVYMSATSPEESWKALRDFVACKSRYLASRRAPPSKPQNHRQENGLDRSCRPMGDGAQPNRKQAAMLHEKRKPDYKAQEHKPKAADGMAKERGQGSTAVVSTERGQSSKSRCDRAVSGSDNNMSESKQNGSVSKTKSSANEDWLLPTQQGQMKDMFEDFLLFTLVMDAAFSTQ